MKRPPLALLLALAFAAVSQPAIGIPGSLLRASGETTSEVLDPVTLSPPALPAELARTIDPVIDALWTRFSRRTAMAHVRFISQYWRLAGNVGYDATINRVRTRLLDAGFRDAGVASTGGSTPGPPAAPAAGANAAETRPTSSTWVEAYPNAGKGWNYTVGTLAIAHSGGADEVVLSHDQQNLSLCINSFSTPDAGVVAPLVDVGRGREADFAGKDVKGAVVLGDADPGSLAQTALAHGAIGVISTSLGEYVSPDLPGAPPTPRDQWNILQWGSIRYDEARRPFGFKATPHAAATLRKALAFAAKSKIDPVGVVRVRVTIASTFSAKPNRMLVAEIPGRTAPNERVVITAHVQEPGANDNASGVATLAEMARAMRLAIRSGAIPPPDRTITFLWLEEISGSRQWLTTHADEAKQVKYMFSMDMTGEDVRKTGGSFLIERWPDPGAVWDRPWDPDTEWGRGDVRENQLKGDLLNDLHLAICGRVAAKTGWVVKTNPYEGGSDHTEFGRAGIPSVLDWHFTDRYYHTNYDTADKTSPNEMRNVGVSVAASAWLLASAGERTSLQVADLVAAAGRTRIAIEEREGQALASAAADPAAARTREATIVQAWRKWYGEAVHSVARLVVGTPSATFAKTLDDLAATVETQRTSWLGPARHVADGVDYFTTTDQSLVDPPGPTAVYLLKLDPSRVRLDSVHARDEIMGLETVASITARHGAVAAINGGFFNTKTGEPVAVLKEARELVSDSAAVKGAVIIRSPTSGRTDLDFDQISARVAMTFNTGGVDRSVPIDGVDTTRARGKLMLYTPSYHADTDTAANGTEWSLAGQPLHVIAVRRDAGRSPIPKDGAVLSFGGLDLPDALQALAPGARVAFKTVWTSTSGLPSTRFDDADAIINGAGLLRRQGREVTNWVDVEGLNTTNFINTRHPRTLIGLDRTGAIWFAVADGRQPGYAVGMQFSDLERLCDRLGLTDALNLDGGGSSTMVVDGTLVNKPSDASGPRPVSDAILATVRR